MCMLPLVGLDARVNPEPETMKIERPNRKHMIFGAGPHLCLGHFLAKLEMRILTEEWIKRIPSFELQPDYKPDYRLSQQLSVRNLLLQWPANAP